MCSNILSLPHGICALIVLVTPPVPKCIQDVSLWSLVFIHEPTKKLKKILVFHSDGAECLIVLSEMSLDHMNLFN
jgi:hypothetical protein